MSLTAADAVILFSIPGVVPIPQMLQKFMADDIFDTEAIEAAETVMGVDGFLSAGFVYASVKQGYSLQGDSESNAVFDNWYYAEQVTRSKLPASATIILPALGIKYSMQVGYLKTYKPISDLKKIIQGRKHIVEWQRALPSAA